MFYYERKRCVRKQSGGSCKTFCNNPEELAGDALCEGEIVSIPWGGTPSVKYYKGKFVTGDNRIATSSKPGELLNKYLYYYLRGHLRELASYYRGAGLKHPAMKDVLKMSISYPCIEDQEEIIKQFESLEKIITLRQQELQKLDALIKARFVEMFGSEQYPKQTLISLIKDAAGLSYGIVQPGDDGTGDMGVLRPVDFIDGHISTKSIKYIDRSIGDGFRKTELTGDELLITVRGTTGITALTDERFAVIAVESIQYFLTHTSIQMKVRDIYKSTRAAQRFNRLTFQICVFK